MPRTPRRALGGIRVKDRGAAGKGGGRPPVDTCPAASFAPPWKDAAPTPQQSEWWQKFTALRKKQAAALFDLAKQSLQAHQPRVAYELAVEAAREFPDHEQARVILGHQKFEDSW